MAYKYIDTQRRYRSNLKGRINGLIDSAKTRAKKKNIEFNLSREDIYELYEKQEGRCAITGLIMEFEPGRRNKSNPFVLSLDRIDNTKGYTKDNIQLLCWQVNRMKTDLTEEEFIFWIKIISSRASN